MLDNMEENTYHVNVESRKKYKLKRVSKKKPKFLLNSSITSKVFTNNLTMHNKNNMMNTSVVKATLRANNKALAQSLEKVRLDLRTANDMIMLEKKEKQELQYRVATLNRVAGLQDEGIELETTRRIEAKMQHVKSLLHQTSTHLLDAGMCLEEAMNECFSSRLSQVSQPRSSSCDFTQDEANSSPVCNRRNRDFVYQPSSLDISPPSQKDELSTADDQLITVEDGCSNRVEMSIVMEQSVLDDFPMDAVADDGLRPSCLTVFESAVGEVEAVKSAKKKRYLGTAQRVLKSAQSNNSGMPTEIDGGVWQESNVHEEMNQSETKVVENQETACQDDKNTDEESHVEDQIKVSEEQKIKKLRRETFLLSLPTSCTESDKEENKQKRDLNRQRASLLSTSNKETSINSKLPSKADSVHVPAKRKETFCIPKIPMISSDVKKLCGEKSGITTVSSSSAPNNETVFKYPSIPTNPCPVETGPADSDDQTIYSNSDMELTCVIDMTSSVDPGPEEKKTKPAVSLRLAKPGLLTFAAARKESDGTRKAIPTKLTTVRSKTKKQLKLLQEAIAADNSKPNNIFDFHDKTPSHLQDKPSVSDISLNESLNATAPNIDKFRERLQKLKNKVDDDQAEGTETNINGNAKTSEGTGEIKAGNNRESYCKEGVKKPRTKGKAYKETHKDTRQMESNSSSSRNSAEKVGLAGTNETDGDDDQLQEQNINSTKSKCRSKKKDASKSHMIDSEQTDNNYSGTPVKQKSTKSKTKSLAPKDSDHPEVSDCSSRNSSQRFLSTEVSDDQCISAEDVSSKSKSRQDKPNDKSQTKTGLTTSTKEVEGNIKLLPDTCTVYSLPLKGSPAVKDKTRRRSKSQGPSSRSKSKSRKSKTESSQMTVVVRPTRSRSCKRVDYGEINSDEEKNSSESNMVIKSAQCPKPKARSRGRSLKRRSFSQTRSVSRKRVDACDAESSCTESDKEENKQKKDLNTQHTSLLSTSNKETSINSKLPSKADSVHVPTKRKETFCVPKIPMISSDVKKLCGENSGIATVSSSSAPNNETVFKYPSIPTNPCPVESGPADSDDQTIYLNSDMELTCVIDMTSSVDPGPEEKKTKPAVSLRLAKPGLLPFAAARKESDGTRKVIPTKLTTKLTTVRSKTKKMLPEAIAADNLKPNNIFDFHDKTSSHLQEKPSVFDISLSESLNVTAPNIDKFRERLQKLKNKVDDKQANNQAEGTETNINGNSKTSEGTGEIKAGNNGESNCKEKVKKPRTKSKAYKDTKQIESNSSSSINSAEKVSLAGTNETDGDDDKLQEQNINSTKSKCRSKKKDASKSHMIDSEQTDNNYSGTPVKQKSTKSKTKSLAPKDSGHPEVSDCSSRNSSQRFLSTEVSDDQCISVEDVSSKSKSRQDKPNDKSQTKTGLTTSTKEVEGNIKLLPDTCTVYSLPLKGSPAVKDKTRRRSKSQGPSSRSKSKSRKSKTESSQMTDVVRPTRSRSCKRVDYGEINSDEEKDSSESNTILKSAQSPKPKARSRGRSLKRSLTRSVSRKRVDACDAESSESELFTSIHSKIPVNSSHSEVVTESSPTCKPRATEDVDAFPVYSLQLKGSPAVKKRRSKSHGPSQSSSKSKKKNSESSQITDVVKRSIRSCNLVVPSDYSEINSVEGNISELTTVLKSPQTPVDKTKSRSRCRSLKRKSLTEIHNESSKRQKGSEEESSKDELSLDMVNSASCEQNIEYVINSVPVTNTQSDSSHKKSWPENVDENVELPSRSSGVYSSPQKGDPDVKSNEMNCKRSRRTAGAVNYKLPTINGKMRRGDPGSSTLYGKDSVQIYKTVAPKAGTADQKKPLANMTNWKLNSLGEVLRN